MGMFAHSCVIAGVTPEALVAFYRAQGTRAFIYPDERQLCAVCDDNDDEADLDLLVELTGTLRAVALLGQVFDSSVFVGTLFNRGTVADEYIDRPEHLAGLSFGGSVLYLNRALTFEQRAAEWANAFRVPGQARAVAEVIHLRDAHLFAEDFMEAVFGSLLLPTALVGASYLGLARAYETDPEARKVLLRAGD